MDVEDEGLPGQQPHAERVLAALDRAVRHTGKQPAEAVPIWTLLDHLNLGRRGKPAQAVRAALDELARGGFATQTRRHGVAVWEPSVTGRARLDELARAGSAPDLPEAPQHRAWRHARTLAEAELGRLHDELRSALLDAERALEARPPTPSDEWFSIAARLRLRCRRVGSATHVLHEWREPSDTRADIDDLAGAGDAAVDTSALARRRALRAGRRNTRLWRDDGA
ncbi:MAG TPA: hypothetical protein VGG08_01555 [Solirubrobacteraceae bacterium]|jgi:hypothetical protein